MKTCVNCGHPVGLGDRHATYSCPAKYKGAKANRRHRKHLARKKAKRQSDLVPKRGESVAGIHKKRGGESK